MGKGGWRTPSRRRAAGWAVSGLGAAWERPRGLHAIASNGSVTVTWCPPLQGQSQITGYTVKSSTGQTFTASVPAGI